MNSEEKEQYERIEGKLALLDREEIECFRDRHSGDHKLAAICNGVIAKKVDSQRVVDLEKELDEILTKKNAPDGAATPSQGK